jgi:hypothetical protein
MMLGRAPAQLLDVRQQPAQLPFLTPTALIPEA